MAVTPAHAIRFDEEIWARVKLMAEQTEVSNSDVVREAVERYLDAYFESSNKRAAKSKRSARK